MQVCMDHFALQLSIPVVTQNYDFLQEQVTGQKQIFTVNEKKDV